MHERSKIVVFDLDETLGYFTQLCLIWESLCNLLHQFSFNMPPSGAEMNGLDRLLCASSMQKGVKEKDASIEMNQEFFNKLLDLFPEYIRPNIESILEYLKDKKLASKCKNVMIYTNNQRQKNWVFLIKKYFEMRMQYDLFDQIICAFKINGKQVELCRSTHNKTHKDFIKCSKIPANTQICFIDDTYFPEMHSEEVYYIKIKPYTYCLNIETIINRLKKSNLIDKLFGSDKNECINNMKMKLSESNSKIKSMKEYDIDKIITKEIMNHIQIFFNSNQKYPSTHFNNIHKTKKRKVYKNKTRKERHV